MGSRRHDSEALRIVREDLALEIDELLRDLELRREVLRDIWSLHRDRGGFVDTTRTRWAELGFRQLAWLDTHTADVLDVFYRQLELFRLYLALTDDMPASLFERYDRAVLRLRHIGDQAVALLGGVPDRTVVRGDGATAEVLAFFAPALPPRGEE